MNHSEILESLKINTHEEIEHNPVCIEVDGKVWGTLSNFSAIIGKVKSKKSFLVLLALAAAVKKEMGVLKVNLEQDKVLYFDTEQSRYHVQRSVKRVGLLAGRSPDNLVTYPLRKFSPAERLQLIDYAIEHSTGVGMVVIDGLRDLVTSINDEEQATMITTKLLKWTEEKNIHIIIVLHQNKGDNNARGHVGSEVINKAEQVITVTADNGGVVIVKSEYARDKDFMPFAFEVNEDGLPEILENYIQKPEGKRAVQYVDIPKETHDVILKQVFAINPKPRYKELVLQLQVFFEKHSVRFGENKIKTFIQHYVNAGMVQKIENGNKIATYKLII